MQDGVFSSSFETQEKKGDTAMPDLKPPLAGYSLWFMAQKDQHRELQNLVDQLADMSGTKRFIAHATLIGLTDKTESDLTHIKQACQNTLLPRMSPVAVEVMGVTMRDMHFQSVFLPIAPNKTLAQLNSIARMLFNHSDDPPFMPHFSAVYGDLAWDQKKAIAQKILDSLSFPQMVTINSFALVDVTGHPDQWHIIEEYRATT